LRKQGLEDEFPLFTAVYRNHYPDPLNRT
jgi:hypothetical protein